MPPGGKGTALSPRGQGRRWWLTPSGPAMPKPELVRRRRAHTGEGAPPRPPLGAEPGSPSCRVGSELPARPLPVATPHPVRVLCKRMFGIPGNHSCAFSPLFFNGVGRLPFLCFCQLCSRSSCEVGRTGSTSVPRPTRGFLGGLLQDRDPICCLPPPASAPLGPGALPAAREGSRAPVAGPGQPPADRIPTVPPSRGACATSPGFACADHEGAASWGGPCAQSLDRPGQTRTPVFPAAMWSHTSGRTHSKPRAGAATLLLRLPS